MNKKITAVTLTALMVLTMFTALVPSASAITVTEVSAPYEFIGIVNETAADTQTGKYFEMNATSRNNPGLLYFDLGDQQGKEALSINTGTGDKMTLKKASDNLTYTTTPWIDPDTNKKVVAWLGEKYFVVSNDSGKWILSRFIVDEDDTDDYLLRVGESKVLAEGWAITALEIDVEGKKAWISLTKDGEEIENKVVVENNYFLYEKDLGRGTNNKDEVMNFTVDTVFAGMNTNLVKIKNIDLISEEPLELKSGTDKPYDDYKMTVDAPTITVKVNDDVSLTEDGVIDILGGRFQIRVTKNEKMAAIVKTVEVGGGAAATEAPTAVGTEDVTEEPTEAATGAATAAPTAAGTAAATEAPTPEPTKEPGFEAVFAVAGLLAVAYLVLRQRE